MATVDDKEFRKAVRTIMRVTPKTFREITNRFIYSVLLRSRKRASELTPSKEEIARVYGPKIRIRRGEKLKLSGQSRQISGRARSNPFRIWWASRRSGESYTRSEALEKVQEFVSGRYKATGYQAAGFNQALRKFVREVPPEARISRIGRDVKAYNKRSQGFPARERGGAVKRLTAKAIYNLTVFWGGQRGHINPRVKDIIEDEAKKETTATIQYANRKLDEANRKAGLL